MVKPPFQVVDMRWGVRDEATDDHMTTELCMREIENCQRLSMGPNFVVSNVLFNLNDLILNYYMPKLFVERKLYTYLTSEL